MRIPALLAALALGAMIPAPALAHVELSASTPAAGSEAKAPKTVTLSFTQPVDQASTAVALVMTAMPGVANHAEMPIRNFTADWSEDGRTVTLNLRKPLPAGSYEVRWQAAAADGHARSGTVAFAVR